MNNPSIESHFTICHSASFSSQLSIAMKKNKLFKEEKFKVQRGINYNEENKLFKVQIGIKYSEENKLFKVQKRCVFLILHKWSCSLYIDEVLSINPSANVFVFGDSNIHHKDWLTYSGGTDTPGKLCYNFSISSNFTQMVNIPTWIQDSDSHRPALLDFFLSSASICSTMAFPSMRNSDHFVVSVSISFPSKSK